MFAIVLKLLNFDATVTVQVILCAYAVNSRPGLPIEVLDNL